MPALQSPCCVQVRELQKVAMSELGKPNPKAFKTLNRSANKVCIRAGPRF